MFRSLRKLSRSPNHWFILLSLRGKYIKLKDQNSISSIFKPLKDKKIPIMSENPLITKKPQESLMENVASIF